MYESATWSVTLRHVQRMEVFETEVRIELIFVSQSEEVKGMSRKLLQDITGVINPSRM
jgi:hypothetical protein